jgi:hypothetical protein
MAKQTLNVPPFPPLQWDDYFWTGEVVLRTWAGFQSRRGAYGSVSSANESDGSATLTVTPQDDESRTPPTPEQAQAFQHLLDHEEAVSASVKEAIFAAYPGLRESYGYDDEEAEKIMPEIDSPEQLRPLIGLSNVHVLTVAKEGIAYIGFEFGCTWDCEHGLGMMTYRDRVVEVGGADTSFLGWIAERDARSGSA